VGVVEVEHAARRTYRRGVAFALDLTPPEGVVADETSSTISPSVSLWTFRRYPGADEDVIVVAVVMVSVAKDAMVVRCCGGG
jgi:hypothetical protein